MADMRITQPLFSTQVRDADAAGNRKTDGPQAADPKSSSADALRSEAFSWSPVVGSGWSLPAAAAPTTATARTRHADQRASNRVDIEEARRKIEDVTRRLDTREPGRDTRSQLQASLSQASLRMMTGQFTAEVRRVLKEQELILPMLPASREWALKVLNRQYYALRTAAELLKQDNLATVAGRAEVLVSLLSRNKLAYREAHHEVLTDTWALLASIADRIAEDGSDKLCFSTAKTAICLYATAEPLTEGYAPAVVPKARPRA